MTEIAMTSRIMRIHLASWRYFALLTLPPLVVALLYPHSALSVALWALFLITHYYCWRLWLDERLFRLLNKENDLVSFDDGMARLWSIKKPGRSLEERWQGASRLFHRTLWATGALWAALLVFLFIVP